MDRFENEIVFECPFTVECVKTFLDFMHGIEADSLSLVTVLELIKFIKHLGKGKLIYLNFYQVLDTSDFEKNLLDLLVRALIDAGLALETKLLVCLVSNGFDNFRGTLEKVCNQLISF